MKQCIATSDVPFLASIGCSAQELFDFVEDWCGSRDPSFEEVLAVTSIRRDYFLEVQKGRPSGRVASVSDFPAKTAEVDGIAWLPRLLVKAEAKLRGELPTELMYGCGGDRPFARRPSWARGVSGGGPGCEGESPGCDRPGEGAIPVRSVGVRRILRRLWGGGGVP